MRFFASHGALSVLILGVVVLAVTGGEALYADMGHFGPRPIRHSWYFLVLPCLTLNYLGQGAFVLAHPEAVKNPFFEAVPPWALYPMIVLATMAAVIASQAVITGAYSVARQAMQLGFLPRMQIKHTSHETIGQIYVPYINWLLMVTVLVVVLMFRSSTALATAYGISVSATMLIDTLLLALVARALWPRWRTWVLPLCLIFFVVDVGFVVANGAKFLDGAWFPLLLGVVVFTLLRTWRRGRELLHEEVRKEGISLDSFLPGLMLAPPVRVPGTAIFMTADKGVVPHALLHNLKHNKVLHERNVFLTVETLNIPYAPKEKRLKIEAIGDDFYRVLIRFGFMEVPDVPLALMRSCDAGGIVLRSRWTRPISPAARPWWPAATAACRSGATASSRSCTATPPRPRDSSGSRATGWWSWARRWKSEERGLEIRDSGLVIHDALLQPSRRSAPSGGCLQSTREPARSCAEFRIPHPESRLRLP